MAKDAFKARERALEEDFFHRVNEKLLVNLRASLAGQTERQRLAAATGFCDEELLSELVEVGVSAEAVAAISLVPLVLVAWADGKVNAKERPTVLHAAKEQGIDKESPAAKLLDHWLDTEPSPQLAATWRHYVRVLTEKMSDEARNALHSDVIRRARAIAKASGGPLRFGTISVDEKRVIAELEQAFGP